MRFHGKIHVPPKKVCITRTLGAATESIAPRGYLCILHRTGHLHWLSMHDWPLLQSLDWRHEAFASVASRQTWSFAQ